MASDTIKKQRIVITFEAWMPFSKQLEKEVDHLICSLREKKLLEHAGNVLSRWEDVNENENQGSEDKRQSVEQDSDSTTPSIPG